MFGSVASGSCWKREPRPRRVRLIHPTKRLVIYVCIPAHDEGSTIGLLLWKVRKVLGEFGRDYHVVVHDDGSTDGTAAALERYRRTLPLTVLRSAERIGYGRSVEKLLRHVSEVALYPKRDCAVVLQGDFTEDPHDVVTLVKVMEGGADIVAGAIEQDGRPSPFGVRLVRLFSRALLRRVIGRAPVSDPLNGLRAYRIIVLRKALRDRPVDMPLLEADGWASSVELLGQLAPHARRVDETPLAIRHDLRQRESRFRPFQTFMGLARLSGGALWSTANTEAA